jgi:hypothetical protein
MAFPLLGVQSSGKLLGLSNGHRERDSIVLLSTMANMAMAIMLPHWLRNTLVEVHQGTSKVFPKISRADSNSFFLTMAEIEETEQLMARSDTLALSRASKKVRAIP